MSDKLGIHWFRFDLRLNDNPSLQQLSKVVEIIIRQYTDILTNTWLHWKRYLKLLHITPVRSIFTPPPLIIPRSLIRGGKDTRVPI